MTGIERSAVCHALESLRDGDTRLATTLLEGVLRHPAPRGHSCPVCGLGFSWPGQVANHVTNVHGERAA